LLLASCKLRTSTFKKTLFGTIVQENLHGLKVHSNRFQAREYLELLEVAIRETISGLFRDSIARLCT
jgi:hypothetical protein